MLLQSEAPRKRKEKSKKREKDANAPKRPATAFMLWLNENRKRIMDENPGIKVTDVAKRGGELWRDLGDKSVGIFCFIYNYLQIYCMFFFCASQDDKKLR